MAVAYQLGHRERARERFLKRDSSFFEAYELFELLLFYSIPRKDTKGIAKALLGAFPDINSLLSAGEEALLAIDGIGKRSASLIRSAAELIRLCLAEEGEPTPSLPSAPDYSTCGELLVNYYRGRRDNFVVMVSFDNAMNVLGIDEVYNLAFSSGGVKAEGFIKIAVKRCASVAAIAFNHPTGPFFPLPSEMETCKMLTAAFADAGIFLAEQYLISGKDYIGTMQHLDLAFGQRNPEIGKFLRSKIDFLNRKTPITRNFPASDSEIKIKALSDFLAFAIKEDVSSLSEMLISQFGGIRGVVEAEAGAIAASLENENARFLIRILSAIASRSLTEGLKVGRRCQESHLQSFAKGIFFGKNYEETHVLCFDGDNRYLGEDKVSEGTVNSSEVTPRRIINVAYNLGACRIVLVHNHPRGQNEPSKSDIEASERLCGILAPIGIKLVAHYIVAEGRAENFMMHLNNSQ